MTSLDAYIYIIIALLGIAYPTLFQVVSRLDEKYSSDDILQLFNQEWESKAFLYTLYSSIFFLVVWSLKLHPVIQINGLNFLINNSARIAVALNTILLVIFFFLFVKKVLIYYAPTTFIPYLINKHNRKQTDFKYFIALSDFLLLSIKNQQTNISRTLSFFFYSAFKQVRDKSINEPIVYPSVYYEIVYKAIEELAILKEKRNYMLEHRTAGGIWLLGELQGKEISNETYSWIWRNLLLAIRYL